MFKLNSDYTFTASDIKLWEEEVHFWNKSLVFFTDGSRELKGFNHIQGSVAIGKCTTIFQAEIYAGRQWIYQFWSHPAPSPPYRRIRSQFSCSLAFRRLSIVLSTSYHRHIYFSIYVSLLCLNFSIILVPFHWCISRED